LLVGIVVLSGCGAGPEATPSGCGGLVGLVNDFYDATAVAVEATTVAEVERSNAAVLRIGRSARDLPTDGEAAALSAEFADALETFVAEMRSMSRSGDDTAVNAAADVIMDVSDRIGTTCGGANPEVRPDRGQP
jgi:hypothetical protein